MTNLFFQQAIARILSPLFDPTFLEHSNGFRHNRRGHDAAGKAKRYISEGRIWVNDMDLEKFFDKVNHDKLMGILASRNQERLALELLRYMMKSMIQKKKHHKKVP